MAWKGAVHLNFSDFAEEKLEKVIPSKETRILIYCNNNIDSPLEALADKSLPLALNIPTYINLFGYGYQNVYELATRVADVRLAEQLEGEAFDPAAYPPFDDPE